VKDSNKAIQVDPVIRCLLGPADPELTCEECFELLDEYVEHELEGAEADERIPGMRPHLEGCSACHEEHDTLLALLAADRRA
jgi:hypothetical protein